MSHWKENAFVRQFVRTHRTQSDKPFCFVLGAGASVTSGIPSAHRIAEEWLREMHGWSGESDYGRWLSRISQSLAVDPGNLAEAYPRIYKMRFERDPAEGYAWLEDRMAGAEPSFGYSVLAEILTNTSHKVVITTNFDDLVAYALSLYGGPAPVSCGHEALAEYVRVPSRRPMVLKIHRDLLLEPFNQEDQVRALNKAWKSALEEILNYYTPVFIGYGGNDGSLMDFLDSLSKLRGVPYWCAYRDEPLPERVSSWITRMRGVIVRTSGFDELMMQLQNELGYNFKDEYLRDRHRAIEERYRREVLRLRQSLGLDPTKSASSRESPRPRPRSITEKAFTEIARRTTGWWQIELKAREAHPEAQDEIYRDGIAKFPDSADLVGCYARYLYLTGRDYERSEEQYDKALALDPGHHVNLGGYAVLLQEVKRKNGLAEVLYQAAIAHDPESPESIANYARYLRDAGLRPEAADILFTSALAKRPHEPLLLGECAELKLMRQEYEKASDLARKQWREAHGQQRPEFLPVAAYLLALAHTAMGASPDNALGHLKGCLQNGIINPDWFFDAVLRSLSARFSGADLAWYRKVARAIQFRDELKLLTEDKRWRGLSARQTEGSIR